LKVQRRPITPSVVLTQKQRIKSQDLKRCLKKKTVPGVLWINITPLFCVYKAPLAPSIVNGIIPHTSCTFIFTTGYEPGDLPKALLLSETFKQDDIGEAISINLIAQITKFLSIKRAIEPSKLHKALQFK